MDSFHSCDIYSVGALSQIDHFHIKGITFCLISLEINSSPYPWKDNIIKKCLHLLQNKAKSVFHLGSINIDECKVQVYSKPTSIIAFTYSLHLYNAIRLAE